MIEGGHTSITIGIVKHRPISFVNIRSSPVDALMLTTAEVGEDTMNNLYSRIDPRNIPIYSIKDAARYLQIPSSTIRSWTVGTHYPVQNGSNFFEPLIEIPQSKPYLLSFTNLVEIHVLRAIRKHHKIQLDRVRTALNFINEEFKVSHPLATQKFSTDGVDLFVERYGELIQATQVKRDRLKLAINTHLKRIETDENGFAFKLYPFTHSHEENNPRIIVIDPRISFGRLTIDGTGIATSILKERYSAGDSIEDLAIDYNCDTRSIQEAIRCELFPVAA
jgi:uncharacterized protein (DUF433 family)